MYNLSATKCVFRQAVITDIHRRYQTFYTAPCNGIVSHGAQYGGLRVYGHTKANAKQMRSRSLHAAWLLACDCFHAQPAVYAINYAPDEPRLFLLREKPEDPQIEPHT